MLKLCNRCQTKKEIQKFSKNPKMLDGYLNQCKSCVLISRRPSLIKRKDYLKKYKKLHRKNNRERYNYLSREYSKLNPEKRRLAKRKWALKNRIYKSVLNRNWNARNIGMIGSYTVSEYIEKLNFYNKKCGYCLVNSATTVDHMTPYKKGGTNYINNIMPACLKCNGQKGDLTMEEWFKTVNCLNKNRYLLK